MQRCTSDRATPEDIHRPQSASLVTDTDASLMTDGREAPRASGTARSPGASSLSVGVGALFTSFTGLRRSHGYIDGRKKKPSPRAHLPIVDLCPLEREQLFDSLCSVSVAALLRQNGRQYYVRDLAYMDDCYKIFLERNKEKERKKNLTLPLAIFPASRGF